MNHTEYQERVSLYLDNSLNDKDAAELFLHLAACDECRSFMKIAMRVRTHIAEEDLAEVPSSLDRRVLDGITRKSAQVKRSSWYSPVWFTRVSIPLPAAASILFLIIVGSLLFSPLLSSQSIQQTDSKDPLFSKIPASLQSEFKSDK